MVASREPLQSGDRPEPRGRVTPHRPELCGYGIVKFKIKNSMKLLLIPIALATLALTGCDQRKAVIDDKKDAQKDAIDQREDVVDAAATAAKEQSEREADIREAKIEESKRKAEADLDAAREKAEAEAEFEKAKVDAVDQ
jgi:uncharacterized membrane protein YqiK